MKPFKPPSQDDQNFETISEMKKINLTFVKGDLTKQKVDAIVNTVSDDPKVTGPLF